MFIIYLTKTCSEGCEVCWDDDNSFLSEIFKSKPDCFKCVDKSFLLSEDGKSCVKKCPTGYGPRINNKIGIS